MYIKKVAEHSIALGDRIVLAVISADDLAVSYETGGDVLLLDSKTGEELGYPASHLWPAIDLCTISVEDETQLAVGCKDGTVVLWKPQAADQLRILEGHRGDVSTVRQVKTGDSVLLASSSFMDDSIQLWNPANGQHLKTLQKQNHQPEVLCAVGEGVDAMLASADGRIVLLWNPADGKHIQTLEGCPASINTLCTVTAGGLLLLASGEGRVDQVEVDAGEVDEDATDCNIRLWDPTSGEQIKTLEGHTAPVTAICAFSDRDRDLLASTSHDKTVRIWDPTSGTSVLTIPVSYSATSIAWVNGSLIVGLEDGVLAIKLELTSMTQHP